MGRRLPLLICHDGTRHISLSVLPLAQSGVVSYNIVERAIQGAS